MIFYKTMKNIFSNLFSTWEKCYHLIVAISVELPVCLSPPSRSEWSWGLERLKWLKYDIALKWQITFNLWLNAAKNTHYIKKAYNFTRLVSSLIWIFLIFLIYIYDFDKNGSLHKIQMTLRWNGRQHIFQYQKMVKKHRLFYFDR